MNEIRDISVHSRLKEERTKLGFNQQRWAEVVEVNVKTYRRWESEIPIPADKLAQLAKHGADVQYILTGVRSQNLEQVAEPSVQYEANNKNSKEAGALSPRDQAWLELARHLPDDQRTRLQEIGDALVSATRCCEKKDVS